MGKKIGVLAKNKKAQAPKDFQKETRKVGKKKQEAANATKTDFKVKQMQMPSQSALDDKGEEITQRRLGLQELLAHVGHHSAKVRRDAFDGLRELCTAHEHVLSMNLARILEATTTVAIDSSADVREAFRKFQAWLIEVLPAESLNAFASTLAIHVRSALSHVSIDVRTDGIVLLEIYAAGLSISEVLSQGEICRIVDTLCQLTTQVEVVLQCLHRLLYLRREDSSRMECSIDDFAISDASLVPQLSFQSILPARSSSATTDEDQLQDTSTFQATDQADSPIWEFCLRAWLQAGDMPVGSAGGRSNSAASKPGRIRLRCAAVLERALEAGSHADSPLAATSSKMSLNPSAKQVTTLVGLVKRGEWPINVDRSSGLSQLADSINLRMSYVLGLLVAGAAPEDVTSNQLMKIHCAVLNFLDAFSSSATGNDGGVTSAVAALIDPREEVSLMKGAEGIAYAIRALSLLWACTVGVTGAQKMGIVVPKRSYEFGADFLNQLVAVTARFASGAGDEAAMKRASTILATPLVASLIGLRLRSVSMPIPDALSPGWPDALVSIGEPCFLELIEQTSPGSAVEWASTWPKQLWYLSETGEKSGPALSAYLLALLLELAKLAARCRGVHEKIFAGVCPLLVPFFVGRPGGETMPPVALLPRGLVGAQGVAAALLPHFPKMSDTFISALAQLICRWSDVGFVGDNSQAAPSGLGADCCELILEVLLNGRSNGQTRPVRTGLSIALTILCSSPNRFASPTECVARSETAALRLVDYLAGWVMTTCRSSEDGALPATAALSYDDHRRLVLQTFAWPLCAQGLDLAPCLTPRLLCFIFFCVVRLPSFSSMSMDSCSEPAAADLGWRDFLSHFFTKFAGDAFNLESGVATAIFSSPLCDPARGGFMGFMGHEASLGDGIVSQSVIMKRFGQLFVTIWMKVVAASQKAEAYELLVKLCSAKLSRLSLIAEQEGNKFSADSSQMAALFQTVAVLVASISCRNELRLSTSGWSSEGPQTLKTELTTSLQRLDAAGHNFDDLRAMLPLL